MEAIITQGEEGTGRYPEYYLVEYSTDGTNYVRLNDDNGDPVVSIKLFVYFDIYLKSHCLL